jgi:hypothetical protein
VLNLTVRDGARIETRASGAGDSGSIDLTAYGNVALLSPGAATSASQSGLITTSERSAGGNISARVAGELRIIGGAITSSVREQDRDGGNIEIAPGGLLMQSAQVLARANQGRGGGITIRQLGANELDGGLFEPDTSAAGFFLIDSASVINADSQAGLDGTIDVDAPDVDADAVIPAQDASIAGAPELAANACARQDTDAPSTLVVMDRGGVVPAPDDYLGAFTGESGAVRAVATTHADQLPVAAGCR